MTHRTIATTQTVKNGEALVNLLHDMNDAGEVPEVAFVDGRGMAGVAYGVELGDEMGTAYLSNPIDDRSVERDGSESYVSDFEGDLLDLHGPIVVLRPGGTAYREDGGQS